MTVQPKIYATRRPTAQRVRVADALDEIVKGIADGRGSASTVIWDQIAFTGLLALGYHDELKKAGLVLPDPLPPLRVPEVKHYALASSDRGRPRIDVRFDVIVREIAEARGRVLGKAVPVLRVWNEVAYVGLINYVLLAPGPMPDDQLALTVGTPREAVAQAS